MNIYFELNDRVVESARKGRIHMGLSNAALTPEDGSKKHLAIYDAVLDSPLCRMIVILSDRVWVEDQGSVRMLKVQNSDPVAPDLKEFLWVKLTSVPVSAA